MKALCAIPNCFDPNCQRAHVCLACGAEECACVPEAEDFCDHGISLEAACERCENELTDEAMERMYGPFGNDPGAGLPRR